MPMLSARAAQSLEQAENGAVVARPVLVRLEEVHVRDPPPVARLMQPMASRHMGSHGARTVGIRLPGQAALRLRSHGTQEAGCIPVRTRWLHMSAQHANVANAVGSERPRASATSSAKG